MKIQTLILATLALVSSYAFAMAKPAPTPKQDQGALEPVRVTSAVFAFGCGPRPRPGETPVCPESTEVQIEFAGKEGCFTQADIVAKVAEQSEVTQTLMIDVSAAAKERCPGYYNGVERIFVSVDGYVRGKALMLANPIFVQEFARP